MADFIFFFGIGFLTCFFIWLNMKPRQPREVSTERLQAIFDED